MMIDSDSELRRDIDDNRDTTAAMAEALKAGDLELAERLREMHQSEIEEITSNYSVYQS